MGTRDCWLWKEPGPKARPVAEQTRPFPVGKTRWGRLGGEAAKTPLSPSVCEGPQAGGACWPRGRASMQGVWLAGRCPTRLDIRFAKKTPRLARPQGPPGLCSQGSRGVNPLLRAGSPQRLPVLTPRGSEGARDSPGGGAFSPAPQSGPPCLCSNGACSRGPQMGLGHYVWASPVRTLCREEVEVEGGGLLPEPAPPGGSRPPRDLLLNRRLQTQRPLHP